MYLSQIGFAQYHLHSLQVDSVDPSIGIITILEDGTESTLIYKVASVDFVLGAKPTFDLIGNKLFGANVYPNLNGRKRKDFYFVFSQFSIKDGELILLEQFSGTLHIPKGWRVFYGIGFEDHLIKLFQSEHGDYLVSSSLDLSRYSTGDIAIFFKRFKWMSHRPIPKQFRELDADKLLESL